MQKQFRVLVVAATALLVAGTAAAADRPLTFGVQAGFADNNLDFGVGARVIKDLDELADGVSLIGTFDYFFPDGDEHYWELNANLAYTFPLHNSSLEPYAGAGLNLGHSSGTGWSDSELGLNLLGGLNIPTGSLKLFVEAKVELRDNGPFVLSTGLRF